MSTTVEKKRKTAAADAVVMVVAVLALATAAAAADIEPPKDYRRWPNQHPEWATQPDPPSSPYEAPEPADERQRVYRCWGYIARGKATAELNLYIFNGTLPSINTCEGVNRLHPDCWASMFRIYQQALDEPRIVHRLRRHCNQSAPLPPPPS